MPIALLLACIPLLLIAVAASLMLVLEHFGGNLPGCGPESDCAKVASSYWGTVPLIGWPTSFLGLSYFLGLLPAFALSRKGLTPVLRWLIRIGALASLGFLYVMSDEGHICQYCVVVHAANLLLVLLTELARRFRGDSIKPITALAGVFIVSSIVLGTIDAMNRAAIERDQEQALQQTIQDLTVTATEDPEPEPEPTVDDDPEPAEPVEPFTGRYRLGPEKAAIRLVVLTDFACPDCRKIKGQIKQLLAERDDISYSMKHFPMSNVCNRHMPNDMHPKACYAARVAEAAGILKGGEGFWEMYDWLFDNIEDFTPQTLPGQVVSMGYDWPEFFRLMDSPEVDALIQADIEEGMKLGLNSTPMLFINGHELSVAKGLMAPNAVIRAVNAIAATNPPPLTAEHDQPPLAAEKYVQDWRDQRQRRIPAATRTWARGDRTRPLQIVMWGDYQEGGTIELDRRIRAAIEGADDVNYVFRYYPMNQECNPVVSRSLFPRACKAALAAEAAGIVGGDDAWLAMHLWLMDYPELVTDDGLRTAAESIGLPAEAFLDEMGSAAASAGIAEDSQIAKTMGLRAIPFLFVDDRQVPRWRLEGRDIIKRIIAEAIQDKREPR